jgi:hypothetical protein
VDVSTFSEAVLSLCAYPMAKCRIGRVLNHIRECVCAVGSVVRPCSTSEFEGSACFRRYFDTPLLASDCSEATFFHRLFLANTLTAVDCMRLLVTVMVSREEQDKVLLAFQFPDFCSLDSKKKKKTKTKAHSLIVSLITLTKKWYSFRESL